VPADLVEFGRRHLSAVKYPREVRLVDSIPLTSVMKTDRKLQRAMLTAETESADTGEQPAAG
jgi:long-chain acyl-CoA synthetase